ncbi:MAG: hypothetical protein KBD56_05140 [Candidatus Eisenbacteria bacterium]|nr:hypothetical protein [Candidatus Eisenbacteria bacterium]
MVDSNDSMSDPARDPAHKPACDPARDATRESPGDALSHSSGHRAEQALWRALVRRGLRTGMFLEEAQDLASRTLVKALDSYDAQRGSFDAFCRTIHGNLMKNHWRDRKPLEPIDEETVAVDDRIDPLEILTEREERTIMRTLSDRILAALDPEEAAFLLALSDILFETERVVVSQAAARLGMKPLQGWDIFRRIQRKARPMMDEFREVLSPVAEKAQSPESDIRFHSRPHAGPRPRGAAFGDDAAEGAPLEPMFPRRFRPIPQGPPPAESSDEIVMQGPPERSFPFLSLLMLAGACADAGYEKFSAGLTAEQRGRLADFVS